MTKETYHTINELSTITHYDRRTLRKKLADVTPAKVIGNRKYYLRSTIEGVSTRAKSYPVPPVPHEPGKHELRPFIDSFIKSFLAFETVMSEWLKLSDKLAAMKEGDAWSKGMVNQLNQVSEVYRLHVNQLLLFGLSGKGKMTDRLTDVYGTLFDIMQGLLDIDVTLNVSGGFEQQFGRLLKLEAMASERQKQKYRFPIMPSFLGPCGP